MHRARHGGTGNPPPIPGLITPPAVVGLGWSVKFFDDFTNASTVTGNGGFGSYQPGINWYPGQGKTLTSPTNYQVRTSTNAAGVSNGNSGGGSNSSANGGILEITGIASITNQGTLQSTPSALGQTPGSTGGFGPAGYYEAYIQLLSSDTAHIAFWTLPLALNTSALTELDTFEANIGGLQSNLNIGNLNQWTANFGSDIHTDIINNTTAKDSNWHTYGFLISPPTTGAGTMTAYYDNISVGSISVGAGTNYPTVYTDPSGSVTRYMILGKDFGANVMNVDWVRCYAP